MDWELLMTKNVLQTLLLTGLITRIIPQTPGSRLMENVLLDMVLCQIAGVFWGPMIIIRPLICNVP